MPLLLLLSLVCAPALRAPPNGLPDPQERPSARPAPSFQPAAQAPAATDLAPQREADTLPQPVGAWGIVLPPIRDARTGDLLVHEDRTGRAQKQLLDLAGSPEHGFAAVWRDLRDGHAGLYFGRVDGSGQPLLAERALYPAGSSSREIEPAVALSSRGNGAFVWHTSNVPPQPLRLRTFDAQGVLSAEVVLLADLPQDPAGAARPTAFAAPAGDGRKAGGGVRLPAIAMTATWGAVVWGDAGKLWVERFDEQGAQLGEVRPISSPDRPLSGPLRVCSGPDGADLVGCAWTTREGVEFREIGEADGPTRILGQGVLERLIAAPGADGGWWALVQTPSGHRLLGVPAKDAGPTGGAVFTLDLGVSAREVCDLAARGSDLLVSVQRAGGSVELLRLDPRAAAPRLEPVATLDPAGSSVSDLRIAGAGEIALVAWTGAVDWQRDIWLRPLDAKSQFGPARRWNTDEASTPQTSPRIASGGADQAAVVWIDGRNGDNTLLARILGADGKFRTDEIPVTPGFSADGSAAPRLAGQPTDPAVAMVPGGGFLVAWKQLEKRGYRLLGQVFDERGGALGQILEFASGEEAPPNFKAGIAAAAFGRGFAVAFGAKDRGVFVRSVQASGRGMGDPIQVGEHPSCQNPSLAELEGGGLAVAWDISVPGAANKAVRARVLDGQLKPRSSEIEPPLTVFGDDWDPCVCASRGGGFAISFTGGQAHSRDIFLRFLDAAGVPSSPLVPISTRMMEQDFSNLVRLSDGSLCVAWEDDLSAYDHTYVRRVTRARGQAAAVVRGASLTLNQRPAVLNENRGAPDLAPLAGGGFAAVWVDCSRSQGADVRVKVVGPKFDEAGQ